MGTTTFSRFYLSFGQFSLLPFQYNISEENIVGVPVKMQLYKIYSVVQALGLPLFLT